MRVALVTCAEPPEPDPDEGPLLAALRAAGVDAELAAWDEPAVRWGGFDAAVLRSCWNYHLDPDAFLAWLARAERETRIANPPAVVRANLHKRYLLDLERRGIPIVPTELFGRGARPDLGGVLARRGWRDVVVKPCVSAASWRTRRFARAELGLARAFLEELAADRDAMVQPYLSSVERGGERSLVWIAGRWTHAIEKSPRFDGGAESVSQAREPRPQELELARRVLGPVERGLSYARLDLIEGDDGLPLVSELELIEPSLFLVQHPPALGRLVEAIRRLAPRPG